MILQIFSLEGTYCTSGIGRTISLCLTKGSAVGTATKCWIEGDSSLGEIKADALSLTLDGLRKVHRLAKRARTARPKAVIPNSMKTNAKLCGGEGSMVSP